MRLDMEVDLGPGDVVLDGVPAPPTRATAPSFQPMARWMETPLGTEVVVGPGHIVLEDGDPSLPTKGEQPPLLFSADVYCGHGRHLSYC